MMHAFFLLVQHIVTKRTPTIVGGHCCLSLNKPHLGGKDSSTTAEKVTTRMVMAVLQSEDVLHEFRCLTEKGYLNSTRPYRGFADALVQIAREEGFGGMYKVPHTSFTVYSIQDIQFHIRSPSFASRA